jgi:hypothetical protein
MTDKTSKNSRAGPPPPPRSRLVVRLSARPPASVAKLPIFPLGASDLAAAHLAGQRRSDRNAGLQKLGVAPDRIAAFAGLVPLGGAGVAKARISPPGAGDGIAARLAAQGGALPGCIGLR